MTNYTINDKTSQKDIQIQALQLQAIGKLIDGCRNYPTKQLLQKCQEKYSLAVFYNKHHGMFFTPEYMDAFYNTCVSICLHGKTNRFPVKPNVKPNKKHVPLLTKALKQYCEQVDEAIAPYKMTVSSYEDKQNWLKAGAIITKQSLEEYVQSFNE